jgi:hypothetical protein
MTHEVEKMSDLEGSMKEVDELKMDDLTVSKMRNLMKMLLSETKRDYKYPKEEHML